MAALSQGICSAAPRRSLARASSPGSTSSWKAWLTSIGWPILPNPAQAWARSAQIRISSWLRSANVSALGHTHCTPRGVSPQPSAVRPCASATRIRTRPQVTSVAVSCPNFSGTRVRIGRKYRSTATGRTSVGFDIPQTSPVSGTNARSSRTGHKWPASSRTDRGLSSRVPTSGIHARGIHDLQVRSSVDIHASGRPSICALRSPSISRSVWSGVPTENRRHPRSRASP